MGALDREEVQMEDKATGNRAERRHGKKAEAQRKAERKARKDAARARVAENPRLVRHKF